MILQPVKSFSAHWILFGIGRIQGLSMSVISYFAILPTSSLMLSSPVSCPLHYFHSLFSSLWVILFSQPRLSTVYCFVLILSAGILISLFHWGMLFHCSKYFCLSLDCIPLFHHHLYLFLQKFKFTAIACFHHLLSLPYFYCFLTYLFPFCCKFSLRFLFSKSDSVHLYQFKSKIKKAGPLPAQDVF